MGVLEALGVVEVLHNIKRFEHWRTFMMKAMGVT